MAAEPQYNMVKGASYHNVSMGQGQDIIAMERLEVAHRQGHWVILNNVHLMPRWLVELEKRLDQFAQEGSDEKFRLFLSSDPAKNIPIGILARCIKITNEPPRGLRMNLKRVFLDMSEDEWEGCSKKRPDVYFDLAEAVQRAARELGTSVEWGGCWADLNTDETVHALHARYVARKAERRQRPFFDGPHFQLPKRTYP